MQLLFWIAALVVGAAPRRHWDRLDPPFPLVRSAIAAGIVTFVAGCAIGIRGFFHFAGALAGANNDWMRAACRGRHGSLRRLDPHLLLVSPDADRPARDLPRRQRHAARRRRVR